MAGYFAIQSIATITVGTSSSQVNSGTNQPCHAVIFTADGANSNNIFVGDSSVATDKYAKKLAADESIQIGWPVSTIPLVELSSFYVLGGAASQKVHVHFI